MPTIQKNRRACDRCHGQKILCKRETDKSKCFRCMRANAICQITTRPRRVSVARFHKQHSSSKRIIGSSSQCKEVQSDIQISKTYLNSNLQYLAGLEKGLGETSERIAPIQNSEDLSFARLPVLEDDSFSLPGSPDYIVDADGDSIEIDNRASSHAADSETQEHQESGKISSPDQEHKDLAETSTLSDFEQEVQTICSSSPRIENTSFNLEFAHQSHVISQHETALGFPACYGGSESMLSQRAQSCGDPETPFDWTNGDMALDMDLYSNLATDGGKGIENPFTTNEQAIEEDALTPLLQKLHHLYNKQLHSTSSSISCFTHPEQKLIQNPSHLRNLIEQSASNSHSKGNMSFAAAPYRSQTLQYLESHPPNLSRQTVSAACYRTQMMPTQDRIHAQDSRLGNSGDQLSAPNFNTSFPRFPIVPLELETKLLSDCITHPNTDIDSLKSLLRLVEVNLNLECLEDKADKGVAKALAVSFDVDSSSSLASSSFSVNKRQSFRLFSYLKQLSLSERQNIAKFLSMHQNKGGGRNPCIMCLRKNHSVLNCFQLFPEKAQAYRKSTCRHAKRYSL
ncbi:hypothetical protein TWF694_005425 [Orbilia ellipsospora]|uniref:Zn(2)-C6 fungal-type domain-containing protein n=1 Tax=Orbilia ellipsospora TaxID=2528407 RepID=A0AAV9WU44_9PEZI